MKPVRIIPRLDVKGPNLVKGIHLEGLRVLGDPDQFANYYYENGADELIYQDVVASLYDRNNLSEIVKRTAQNIFIPLTVGGGIRNLNDIRNMLRCGADKVCINTQAIKNPEFINHASKEFGSSTIVIGIEAMRYNNEIYYAYTDNGREKSEKKVNEWCREVEDRGAGELIITSVSNEGTGKGFELELINQITKDIHIPIVVHGGAGNLSHFIDLLTKNYTIDGIAVSSMLHYSALLKNQFNSSNYKEGNKNFLELRKKFKSFCGFEIDTLKNNLLENNINVRI